MRVQLTVTFTIHEGAWAAEYGDDVDELTAGEIIAEVERFGYTIRAATSGFDAATSDVVSVAKEVTK